MTREEYAQQWRDHIAARAASYGMTIVDVESGPVDGDDTQLWIEVRDRASGDAVWALTGDLGMVLEEMGLARIAGRWITTDEIETELDQLLAEVWPEEAA